MQTKIEADFVCISIMHKMSATRNLSDLIPGSLYRFTRDVNGYTYTMKFTGTTQSKRSYQEAQWLGNKNEPETVYEFESTHENGHMIKEWVWTDCQNKTASSGVWVPI